MDEYKSTARLVNGVVLQHNGNHYTNANLTDEVARDFLAKYPQRVDWFAVLPTDTKQSKKEAKTASAKKTAKKAKK